MHPQEVTTFETAFGSFWDHIDENLKYYHIARNIGGKLIWRLGPKSSLRNIGELNFGGSVDSPSMYSNITTEDGITEWRTSCRLINLHKFGTSNYLTPFME